VRDAVRMLGERLDGVARMVQQRGVDLAEVKASVAELQDAVRAHSNALSGVSGGLGALPAFGDRIGGLQQNLAALHDRLAAMDEMAGAVGSVQQHVDGLAQELRELRSAFTGIAARVAEQPARTDLDKVSATLAGRIDELVGEIHRLKAATETLRILPDLEERLGRPDGLDIAENVSLLRSELARFADRLSDDGTRLDDRLTKLDERITSLADDAGEPADVDGSGADGAVAVALDELRDSVTELRQHLGTPADDDVDERVAVAVREAVGAAEARLTAHIDEAVLALAEALLRRRTPKAPAAPPTVSQPPPAEEPAPAEEAAADPLADEPEEPPEPMAAAEPAAEPASEAAEPAAEVDDTGRRRRPWWRPGD